MMRICSSNRSIKYAWTRINQSYKASFSRSAHPSFSTNAPKQEIKTISTVRIPTRNKYHRVPLTLVDVQLRDEQLPFAFFFDETLDFDKLASSLEQVLKNYPVISGRIDFGGKGASSPVAIQCGPEDTVSLSYGFSEKPLSFWTSTRRGHSYSGGGGHPILLQIFDPLFQPGKQSGVDSYSRLATFRIIHFAGGGTAITATFNHALADAASSLRFVECWGRETRKKLYPKSVSHDRSSATLSGMISPELAEILGLSSPKANDLVPDCISSRYSVYRKELQDFFRFGSIKAKDNEMEEESSMLAESGHEYVVLFFPPALLKKMKTHGMAQCKTDAQDDFKDAFVSINDMVTAFGWIMKRQLSGQQDWNMSIVVNLRGRGGVDAFSDLNSREGCGKGVFGNAITNVFASMPARKTSSTPRTDLKVSLCVIEISRAASSIRAALVAGLLDVPERVSMSKLGRPVQPVPPAGSSFATTSWGDFPLWQIRFANERMVGFHGHPSFPLPIGRTFSSVIAPTKDGGIQYKLLLPSDKASEARMLHEQVSDAFMKGNA